MSVTEHRVTKADLEHKLRALQGDVTSKIASQRQRIVAAAAGAGVLLLVLAYLLGRRKGRKRSAIVEIRRF